MAFPRVTEMAHTLIEKRLLPGARAIDATVGNGQDTLFLARCVGPDGRVDGFDIQEEAIASANRLLEGIFQVSLHLRGHETMREVVAGPVDAIMFNLGYLPAGDKDVITTSSTTLPALSAALELLSDGGILTIIVYPGHEGGKAETLAVESWLQELDSLQFRSIEYGPKTSPTEKESPYLLAVERRR